MFSRSSTAALTGAAYAAGAVPISVRTVWSRPSAGTAVIYATIHNDAAEPDRLIGATSPVATHIGLHQSSETKLPAMSMHASGSMSDMPMSGSMMSMKTLSAIPIRAGGTTSLERGGYHLMLDLRHDLEAGQTFALWLHFARAGWVTATAAVGAIR